MAPTPPIPASTGSTVEVSVIHGGRIALPMSFMVKNPVPGHDMLDAPCYSFLIENKQKNKKVLYDLGLMKAFKEKQSATILNQITTANAVIDIERDVADQLREATIPLESINAIIWSHHHFDHTGDPSLFPPSTSLVVGPGFKSNKTTFPGYPTNPDAIVVDDAFHSREVIELDFSTASTTIGGFPAIDYFDDGSFYILQSQGHTDDHISGLARTSENKFIFFGGDIAHHPGEYRPTADLPLPAEIHPSPLPSGSICPGSIFEDLNPVMKETGKDYRTTPFYDLNPLMNANAPDAEIALQKMQVFDASAEVFVIIAHDSSLLDILPFFPRSVTDWDVAGYKTKGTWIFLRDFLKGVEGR